MVFAYERERGGGGGRGGGEAGVGWVVWGYIDIFSLVLGVYVYLLKKHSESHVVSRLERPSKSSNPSSIRCESDRIERLDQENDSWSQQVGSNVIETIICAKRMNDAN